MGKQRSSVMVNKAEQLFDMFKDKFSADFEQNKKALDELGLFKSKTDRNIVAGYIVRLARRQEL